MFSSFGKEVLNPLWSLRTLKQGRSSISGPSASGATLSQRKATTSTNSRRKERVDVGAISFRCYSRRKPYCGNTTPPPPSPPREQYFALLRLGMPQRSLGSRLPNAPVSTTNHEMLAYVLLGRPMSQKYTNPTHFTTPKQHYTARGPHFHAPCTYPIHHGAYRVHLRVCTS